MQEIIIRKVIRFFGNITRMSEKIGVSRSSIYRYLEGKPISPDIASRIEKKSNKKFKYKDLIYRKNKYYLELDVFPGSLVELLLKKIIIIPGNVTNFPDQKNLPLSYHRAICVDQSNHLIYGLEHIEAAQLQRRKTVSAWRVSLEDIRDKK